ncbi:MAG TPA: alpha/beta hydrolase [Micromonosporaceae bacterium]
MHVDVNGTRLWFDVDGPLLVPDGPSMRRRPTVVLVHGGPGGYDHSYFKPHFAPLAARAQVVYLDLRDHGRSARGRPTDWSFETCADDLRMFCDALGIESPVVLGHSMGGFVAMLYGTRYPDHPRALILQSTMARFDLDRLVESFRATAGDEVAALARRDYGGDSITDDEWALVFAAFGPHIPDSDTLARRVGNPDVGEHGMALLRALDVVAELPRIACPTLVCVGDRDGVTPVSASTEIVDGLRSDAAELAVIEGAGHFPWLDRADEYWDCIGAFLATVADHAGGVPIAATIGRSTRDTS